jgi:hypothetical protein
VKSQVVAGKAYLIVYIYITHPWSWALLEKLSIVQLLKNLPAFYGTRRFITVFTRAYIHIYIRVFQGEFSLNLVKYTPYQTRLIHHLVSLLSQCAIVFLQQKQILHSNTSFILRCKTRRKSSTVVHTTSASRCIVECNFHSRILKVQRGLAQVVTFLTCI